MSSPRWRSKNADKVYAHQRETTGSSSDSLHLRPFFKLEIFLKGKNLLPELSEFFPLSAVLYGIENHFYHIG